MIWKASVNVFLIALLSMCFGMGLGRLDLMQRAELWASAAFLGAALLLQVIMLRGELLKLKRMALTANTAEQFQ